MPHGRKKKADDHQDAHRWVVSYADFITLLFAFFVVMYAISSVNVSKYKSLAQGMHSAFAQKGDKKPSEDPTNPKEPNSPTANKNSDDPFGELVKSLANLQDSDYQMSPQDGWIELDMKAGALFESGSADLRPIAFVKLMQLAGVLQQLPYPIALEGYTDNMPISTAQYPSNWELSAARAASVARLLTIFGVGQGRITVTGFGEQYPVADNSTDEGRAQNRRVNMIIAKDKSVPRLLNPAIIMKNQQLFPKQETEQNIPKEYKKI
ncbi:flagellar motor protein MotB [Legionella jordanis]|uniref:Flagellar motor protein MotD n=1 Tax=Legionella jordanis TaxID=456 RepID=A0A0W0V8S0_9GAMM|nr:OmpA family protein [Legionella jordanis]KTD16496.1 flagellar motor protein MotD [Legionella jordanis]RMX03957.1 flagellar motor protein MotD [Legionella jordanis]RMX21974.1 flagellar motor protein MotD [Legionella jordanis]VEH12044.1 flagellar motor protein MotB [Legionella jordanis]HAT8712655.1 flagellar motor protein MotD [Legionella jordanis]